MKYLLLLIPLLFSNQFFSQKTTIQIVDFDDKKPIENVQIYFDSDLIASTNKNGNFKIKTTKLDQISLVKEDYYDTLVKISSNDKIIYLKKIKAILLDEVLITNLSVENLLDSIYNSIMKLKNIKVSNHYHYFNSLSCENDTLAYINKIISHKNRDGDYCKNDKGIINNFKIIDDRNVYTIKNSEIVFNHDYLNSGDSYANISLQLITKFKKKFKYTVSKSDGFYKITFLHKKKNREFPYSGYLLVDAVDYGVYEFDCKTINTLKNKRNLTFKNKIINFKILKESTFLKNEKNENNKYELITYSFDSKVEVMDGDLKGSIFISKCRKETTFPFDDTGFKKIELHTYKLVK